MTSRDIDIVALNVEDKIVNLIMEDTADWNDARGHIDSIQEKILKYVAYVDQGKLVEDYPQVVGYQVIIKVIFQQAPNDQGLVYIKDAQKVLEDVGYHLAFINYSDL